MIRNAVICLVTAAIWGCGGSSQESNAPVAPEPDPAAEQQLEVAPDEATEAAVATAGLPRQNKIMRLAVTAGGFVAGSSSAPGGLRNYRVALRGASRSRNDVGIEVHSFVYSQNENGCISRPVREADWLTRPFGDSIVLSAGKPTEGELGFLVPADTQRIRVLIAPSGAGGLVVPVGDDFEPSWPEPLQTIDDGSTLRLLVLPAAQAPAGLPPPGGGREQVVMDFVIENLSTEQGIEFTTSQQLRLVDQSGKFVQPSAATQQIGCRLDDGDVVPPKHARRLMAVYDMPPGEPRRLNYRGFEVDEVTVDLP